MGIMDMFKGAPKKEETPVGGEQESESGQDAEGVEAVVSEEDVEGVVSEGGEEEVVSQEGGEEGGKEGEKFGYEVEGSIAAGKDGLKNT